VVHLDNVSYLQEFYEKERADIFSLFPLFDDVRFSESRINLGVNAVMIQLFRNVWLHTNALLVEDDKLCQKPWEYGRILQLRKPYHNFGLRGHKPGGLATSWWREDLIEVVVNNYEKYKSDKESIERSLKKFLATKGFNRYKQRLFDSHTFLDIGTQRLRDFGVVECKSRGLPIYVTEVPPNAVVRDPTPAP